MDKELDFALMKPMGFKRNMFWTFGFIIIIIISGTTRLGHLPLLRFSAIHHHL